MPSVLGSFEYDIFISYRHNDNRSGWVTEFVNVLQEELASTIKNTVSVYFDSNPHDGLLETHNVDKSLEGKLKSLIFIPIISQTYCDPKSFAWEHEFCVFNKLAKEDILGRDIKLNNGNVASRILPIRIHDLDTEDRAVLENEIGAVMRCIDFIYKETGVNRPLNFTDNKKENQDRTDYRNQINKTANAVKEILHAVQRPSTGKAVITIEQSGENKDDHVQPSIAVLPFVNMSNDPDQEYFSDGISEEIINTLVQIPNLKVAGRSSSFSFKNKNEDLRAIGEKLNVTTLLEGSVRKSGSRIRITAQLIEASTGFHFWSQKFDRELEDVFAIQDEIAKAIVDQLQITLSGHLVEPGERTQTQNVEAYELYLKGMAFFYRRGLAMFEGLRCFEAALKLDNNYALALAGVADTYTMLCLHSYLPPEEVWPKAVAAAQKALEFGPDLAEVHSAIATIALLYERDWNKAESEYKKTLDLNPRYLQGRSWYALFYLNRVLGDSNEALKQAKLSVENDPLSAYAYTILCNIYTSTQFREEGIAAALKAVEYDEDSFATWYFLGVCTYWSGNITGAPRYFNRALEISGRHNWALTSMVVMYKDGNLMKEANVLYNELLTKSKLSYVAPSLLSIAAAALGKNDDAIRYAQEACDRHDPYQVISSNGNWFESRYLMAIPEYKTVLKSLSLPKFSS